ncbi:MAG: LysE family translocator [Pseudomonadota bacterium]
MTWELLLTFNIASIAAWLSPGPAMLVAIRTALVKGRQAGILIGVGLAFIASMWVLAALLGLHVVFKWFPWAYIVVKVCGAAYLFYIAWNTWKDARKPLDVKTEAKSRPLIEGMLLNLSNPKSVLFAAAVLVVIFPPDISAIAKAGIVINLFVFEVTAYTILAYCMTTKAVSESYLRLKVYMDRFAAIVLSALGLRLLFQK